MTDLSPSLAATLDEAVNARFDEEVRFLAELVKVPSDNPPGDCAPHAVRAAELLEAMGFTVERHPVPAELVRANGMVSATNLVIRHRFGDGPTVALNAHGDVVPPGEGWSSDPYGAEIRDGVMYGRGVAVSKSDFATYAFALQALMASMGASKNRIFRSVIVPSTLPAIIGMFRINIGFALVGAVVGEFISSQRGLGHLIYNASSLYDLNTVWAGLFVLMFVGFVLYHVIDIVERRILPWRQVSTAGGIQV